MFHRSPPALLFDLDGTLVDTAPDLAAATDHVLEAFGRPPIGLAQVRQMVGDGALALIRRGFDASGPPADEPTLAAGHRLLLAYYGNHVADTSRPFPGVVATLERLRTAGHMMAVCTNKPHRLSVMLLEQLGLLSFFGAVVGGDSLAVRKPDPGHITGTLAALNHPAGAGAVMVGDSMNDVASARGAGIPVVAVSFGYTTTPPDQLGADRLIDDFAALPAALQGLA